MWQLQPGLVPALEELTVCTLVRLSFGTTWTGFVYKPPGRRDIELGLQGTRTHLSIWLFGKERRLSADLKLHDWHSICLSWSGHGQRLRVMVNATSEAEVALIPPGPRRLAPGGSLTLGTSHYLDASGQVKAEAGSELLGEIGSFRMWAGERRPEELEELECADGDVVSWDSKQWKHSCPPVADGSLKCGKYNIQPVAQHH